MQTNTLIRTYLKEHLEIARGLEGQVDEIEKLFNAILNTYEKNGDLFCFGNGGGASTAEHFASDIGIHPFVSDDKKTPMSIKRLRVHCLNQSVDLITRIANDIGFVDLFSEQLKRYELNKNDTVIAFSISGHSSNIIRALLRAREFGATTVLIGGRTGGEAKAYSDICILVPGTSQFPGQVGPNDNCFNIEDFQVSISHMMAGLLKEAVCKN